MPTVDDTFDALIALGATGFQVDQDLNITWVDSDVQPTQAQIDAKVTEIENAKPLKKLRDKRNRLLAETDWWALPDSPTMTQAQTNYRQALRDITDSYSSMDDEGFAWPTKP